MCSSICYASAIQSRALALEGDVQPTADDEVIQAFDVEQFAGLHNRSCEVTSSGEGSGQLEGGLCAIGMVAAIV
ncbi:MAG: hypothetical protein BMS9Abin28_2200 [Anaerolineae bacterium]|nr:MAG: hypothetical protein BMS9Abin28_2200 [Anaerolineae bacterium]